MAHLSMLHAAYFAAEKHRKQTRKADGSPYINHPLGVADILRVEGSVTDNETLIAAILHDTVEDTNTTFEEIESLFGKRVADIVKDVTDDKSLSKDDRKRKQVEHAVHCSEAAKLVKMADKIYNLRDIIRMPPPFWTTERTQGYFVWSRAVLNGGLRGVNKNLEDILDNLFATGKLNGSTPVIPTTDPKELDDLLKAYYDSMAVAKN